MSRYDEDLNRQMEDLVDDAEDCCYFCESWQFRGDYEHPAGWCKMHSRTMDAENICDLFQTEE